MTSIPIRFVYFDLGNILVAFDRDVAARNVAELFYTSPTGVQLELVNEIMHDSGLQNQFETGLVSEAEFAEAIRRSFPEAPDLIADAAILRAVSDMFSPIETMTDVLARVRQAGLPIGILSNTCQAHWSWVRSQSYRVLQGPFDTEVVSYEVRSMKPDRVIYEVAENRAQEISRVKPQEILFVDDREENVMAARRYGWNAEVCWGGASVEEVLVRYGVLPDCRLIAEPIGVRS